MTVSNSGMTLYQDMDTDTNWVGEDGISTEEFQQGSASQQWIVAKNGNETATLTLSTSMTGAKYLVIPMVSTISPFYTSITATLGDGTNTDVFTLADQLGGLLHRAVAGQWQFNSHMLQFSGSLTLANFASVAINVDNSSSGNIRSVLNHYIDAIYYGTGRTISGTTTTDKLFKESNDVDQSSDVFDGCTLEFSGGIDAQTDITVSTTTGNSFGETLTFREVPNTDNDYTLTIGGTADFRAMAVSAANSNVTVNLVSSGATACPITGGSLVGAGTTTFKASEDIKGVVFTDRTSVSQNGSNFEDNTINTSGAIDVLATGTFTNNIINKSTSPLTVVSLATLDTNSFISSGTGYGIDLGTIAATQSMTWNSSLSGYVTGTAGTDVGVTPTGNEAILVSVDSGQTLTISVASGASIPSVANSGLGTVDVVSSFSLTLTGIDSGVNVTIVNSTTRAELQHSTSTGADIVYPHSGSGTIDILLMGNLIDPNDSDIFDLVLTASDSSIPFKTNVERNYENP